MKKLLILLTIFLAIVSCQSRHLKMKNEDESTIHDESIIWFGEFVDAAAGHQKIQEVIDKGEAKNYLNLHVAWEDDEYTPLHYAAEQGNLKMVQALIAKGLSVFVQTGVCKRTPLHLAALAGHLHVVKFLVNQEKELLNVKDHQNNTVLFYAASGIQGEKNTKVVQWLVEQQSVDPKIVIDEISLLDCAVNANNSSLVKLLIGYGFDYNVLKRSLDIAKGLHRDDVVHRLEQAIQSNQKISSPLFPKIS